MADDLHQFATTTLYAAIQHDVHDLRVFSRLDLVNACYFHVRRLLLIQPGWSCRALAGPVDLAVYRRQVFLAAFRFDFHLSPGSPGTLPADDINKTMTDLRRAVIDRERTRPAGESGSAGRGYLFGVFDSEESWLYPDEPIWQKQSIFWLPVNCREFAEHDEWLARWGRAAAS